jgi:hypothetical protein
LTDQQQLPPRGLALILMGQFGPGMGIVRYIFDSRTDCLGLVEIRRPEAALAATIRLASS